MNIPKVKFIPMSLEENIETIKWAFYEITGDLDLHYYTIKYFNELANLDINMPKEEVYRKIEEVVTKHYQSNKNVIESEIERYNNIWKKYNDKYFNMLTNYLQISFPDNIKQIHAKIGFIPVYPRYLDEFSFSISPNMDGLQLTELVAHETLHFLWFEKWKQIHPETKRSHYDSPYIEWKYSEMVTDPILNNYPFNNLFNFYERGYKNFYELYDGNELVMDKLRNIYSSDESIDKKINNGFSYVRGILESDKIKNK